MSLSIDAVTAPSDELRAFVAAALNAPYRWLAPFAEDRLRQLAVERFDTTLRTPGVQTWVASAGSCVEGVVVVQPLAWDSRVLRIPAARLDLVVRGDYGSRTTVADRLLDRAIAEANRSGLRHVSVRLDAADHAAVHALERHGFLNVDALLTFGAPAANVVAPTAVPGVQFRVGGDEDSDGVGEIAAASFRHGRFHADPAFDPADADAVYRVWASAACRARSGDGMIVAADGERLVGFIACRVNADAAAALDGPAGTIMLIASAAEWRGRGVGVGLIAAAGAWFRQRGVVGIEVGTQLSNVAASRLYERCGLRVVAGSLSFRLVISE